MNQRAYILPIFTSQKITAFVIHDGSEGIIIFCIGSTMNRKLLFLLLFIPAAADSFTLAPCINGKALQFNATTGFSCAPPTLSMQLLWIGLAACASTLLLAITSHLTQNVAPIPLLWIAPLSLYLLSFILCFESDRIYNRYIFLPLLVVSLGLIAHGDYLYENNEDVKRLVEELCAAFFVCCMVCHGELARRRPNPRYLTQFYLMVSVGGAIGGVFVAIAAPRWFQLS